MNNISSGASLIASPLSLQYSFAFFSSGNEEEFSNNTNKLTANCERSDIHECHTPLQLKAVEFQVVCSLQLCIMIVYDLVVASLSHCHAVQSKSHAALL